MGCAGIIAASHTTDPSGQEIPETGMFSLYDKVKILPVRIFNDSGEAGHMSDSDLRDAIHYAWKNGAEILSNSWGFGRDDMDIPLLTAELDSAYRAGRNGLGCPVIFSSGNSSPYYRVQYPARLQQVLAVGALMLDDYRFGYSQFGDALDLCAPSGLTGLYGDVFTLDQLSFRGYNPNYQQTDPKLPPITWECNSPGVNDPDYDCRFGGTSAAAPVVSGTAALILAYDNNLTADEVYDILRYSAVPDVGGGTINPPDYWYGYGRVDAFRAILSIARGDVDADPNGVVDIADLTLLIDHLFISFAPLKPTNMVGNIDCDPSGEVSIADLTMLIDHLFISLQDLPIPCFNFVSPN